MFPNSAMLCLALNIYHESRGEPHLGQVAVAMVTMNRASWDADRVCEVVYQPRQFSWTPRATHKKPTETKAWTKAQRIASDVLSGKVEDTTLGATYFHTHRVKPVWRHSFERTTRIGNHIFYRE
ncbi:cell wall hydrolase [Pseudomonas yamanorum]|uniref:Cell wall hydrolase n=1 Tax=Pseudomonas yamanorum TaxID=515393 RepID=A0AAJ3H360_9PSED|nr:cell wall hydrolase [Pseudomonas yamanorum]NWD42483.1 cell wall hydrolase [Pseudomonas yamanorum]